MKKFKELTEQADKGLTNAAFAILRSAPYTAYRRSMAWTEDE